MSESSVGEKVGDDNRALARRLLERMQQDLRLAIITLYTLCMFLAVGPFALYRLAIGDWLIAAADGAIVAAFGVLAWLAWKPAWTRSAANATAAVAAASVVGVVLGLGLSHQWVFSTLVGNYLLADRRAAIVINTLMVVAVALQPRIFADGTEQATFVAVAAIVSLFSIIFASRVHRQRAQLTELAERDALTGAYNRRSLDRQLPEIVEHAEPGQPDSLAMIDLDDFKKLNDAFGHDVGDQVLKSLTRIVDARTRDKDRFYRYGGEEFLLLMPRTGLEGAVAALEKLRTTVTAEIDGEREITFSAGVAEYRAGESLADWVTRADRALLKAKRGGKNRVEQG